MPDRVAAEERYESCGCTYGENGTKHLMWSCTECGAVVWATITHDAWHERMDAVAETAQAADATASMWRPIGG